MKDTQFNAILAKNQIARMINKTKLGQDISIAQINACLNDIEKFTGTGNQPSINDIIENDNV